MILRLLRTVASAKGWQPWGALVPLLGIAFVASTVVSVTAVLQRMGLVDADENPIGLSGFVAFLLLPFTALGIVVLAWVRLVERRPLAAIGLGGARRARTFLGGLLVGVAMVAVIVAGIWIGGGLHIVVLGRPVHSLASLGSIAALLVCFAVQSGVEELFFRGWMLSAIAAKFRVVWAVLLSSLVFSCLHFDPRANWVFVLNVFLFAVFACCWVIRTNNVWGVMGWHAGWNWLLAVGFELRVTALDANLPALLVKLTPVGSDYLTGGIEGPEGSILCTLILACGIAYQLICARRSAPLLGSGERVFACNAMNHRTIKRAEAFALAMPQ
jgi:membrane protease YdiL (CAAX protease family)